MVSNETTMGESGASVRPSWLPTEGSCAARPAGQWWDAIAVKGSFAARTWFHLRAIDPRTGPVLFEPRGPVGTWYFLVPVGTTDQWDEPRTRALGSSCYVTVPGDLDLTTSSGLRWMRPPGTAPEHVDPAALRAALAAAQGADQ